MSLDRQTRQQPHTAALRATRLGAVLSVLALLAAVAASIATAQSGSRATLSQRFDVRVSDSAELIAAYVSELAGRAESVAARQLAGAVEPARLQLVCDVFGFAQCEVLGGGGVVASSGRLPALPAGERADLFGQTRRDGITVSGALTMGRSAGFAVALGYRAAAGERRVLLATVAVAGTPLPTLLRHVVLTGTYQVLLLDASSHVLERSRSAPGAFGESDEAAASVPGTGWRLQVSEPKSQLFAPDGGLSALVPWVVFGLVALLAGVLLLLFLRSQSARRRLEHSMDVVEQQAATDPLTGLANRRQLEAAMAQLAPGSEPFSVMMIDLDYFKQVNDTFGHAVGDELLRVLSALMRRTFGAGHVYGRWGGDEFVAFLPGASDFNASRLAARLLDQVAAFGAAAPLGAPVLSATIGTATSRPGSDVRAVLVEADRSLLANKRGRPRQPSRVGA